MTSGMMQVCPLMCPTPCMAFNRPYITLSKDSIQVSPSLGPRFRPYASPNHQVTKGRYITSNDPRGYMSVPFN